MRQVSLERGCLPLLTLANMSDDQFRMGRTRRLELDEPALFEFEAIVLEASPKGVVLDRSAFYPGGGGQPPDRGALVFEGRVCHIEDVRQDVDLFLVPSAESPLPRAGQAVKGVVDAQRRRDLMRTHTALHILSGVMLRDFGARVTGGSIEPLSGRLDFNIEAVAEGFRELLEMRCNVEVQARRPIRAFSLPRDEAMRIPEIIRTATNLLPDDLATVRIVSIEGLDTQADGGTHVANTREVGPITIAKVENKGKGFRRVRVALEPGLFG